MDVLDKNFRKTVWRTACALEFFGSRWVKNDYELVRWPPDAEKDKAVGIFVAGEEEQRDVPDAAQVSHFTPAGLR